MFCSIKSYNTCLNACLSALTHSPTIVLPFVYCSVDGTLFKVGQEIRGSDALSHCCCYGNHIAGSKPIKNVLS